MMTSNPNVVIVDYGMGNLFSIERVINHLGGTVIISKENEVIESAQRLILPGVGAFGDGINNLTKNGLDKSIKRFVQTGRPLLGICLGMQLLITESEENGLNTGLDLIPGRVIRFLEPESDDSFYKIPHVGWNRINPPTKDNGNASWNQTILNTTEEGSYVYFVHSFVVTPDSRDVILSETEYGRNRFCSAVRQENIFGCQFHPEVSGEVGLQILREFLSLS